MVGWIIKGWSGWSVAVSEAASRQRRWMHFFLRVFDPPNLGLSRQNMHLPQSLARHPGHWRQPHVFFPTPPAPEAEAEEESARSLTESVEAADEGPEGAAGDVDASREGRFALTIAVRFSSMT